MENREKREGKWKEKQQSQTIEEKKIHQINSTTEELRMPFNEQNTYGMNVRSLVFGVVAVIIMVLYLYFQ